MSAVLDPLTVRLAGPETVDRAEVVALDAVGLARLELDATAASERVVAGLRRWRDVSDERRGLRPYLTWFTDPRVSS